MIGASIPEFEQRVYEITCKIPCGSVATYGQIAWMMGMPGYARQVGRAMKYVSQGMSVPCHRVVNASGRTVPGWEEQRVLLEKEGIAFKKNGNVDLKRFIWREDIENGI